MWGSPPITFVNARVITPGGGTADSIRLRGGRIDRVGGGADRHDAVIDLDEAVVVPGLVNAHDHLELNSFPRLKWRERHANVREWIADFQPRFATDPDLAAARPDTLGDRLWIGGLKNLLSGVTTVCHHNPLHRPLGQRFPVRVVRRFRFSHSLQIDGPAVADVYRNTPPAWPWVIHAAEGVDAEACGEIDTLAALGCLGPRTVLVHGVAITAAQSRAVIESGGSLVWCPTSNEFLFGDTANVRPFAARSRLAIGSDSRLSGAGDLLDEMRGARATGQLSAEAIARAVTESAADVLRLPCAGRLQAGFPADLTVIRRRAADPYETLVSAVRADVRLTMIDGRPLVGDPGLAPLFAACRAPAARVRIDGAERLLARWIARRAARLEPGEAGLEVEV